VVLQSASLAARLAGRRTPAVGLGAASMAVTAAAGFVGGHLVQGRGAMVNRVAANTGPTRWVKTVAEDDLVDGEPKGVDVEGRKVLLYRDHGTVYAIDDLCSHAGALLSRGPVVNCVVTCPLHESQFDVRDGHIVRGPAHHPQPALPARVRNGWVEIRGSQPVKRRART
jgi:nitrite reductase/ring-hydroxylating ferredoxin subunit